MLNILKYDFYKLTHSKKLKIFYIIAISITFLVDAISYIAEGNNASVLNYMYSSYSTVTCCILVFFVPLFVGEDFTSGYIKNVYTNTNKLYYVLSKLIYIIAFCVTMWLVEFVIYALFVYIFGGRCIVSKRDYINRYNTASENTKFDPKAAYLTEIFSMFGLKLLGFIGVGAIMMFFTALFKNDIIVACVGFAYSFFLSGLIVNFLRDSTHFLAEYFLPFGTMRLCMSLAWEKVLGSSLTLAGFSILFTALTWVIVKFRRV